MSADVSFSPARKGGKQTAGTRRGEALFPGGRRRPWSRARGAAQPSEGDEGVKLAILCSVKAVWISGSPNIGGGLVWRVGTCMFESGLGWTGAFPSVVALGGGLQDHLRPVTGGETGSPGPFRISHLHLEVQAEKSALGDALIPQHLDLREFGSTIQPFNQETQNWREN